MERILHCQINNKNGFKYGENGKCYTYNQNDKSKLKAFELAKNDQINGIRQNKNI
jgi:hypothetical protein